jgi:hypothetical protein
MIAVRVMARVAVFIIAVFIAIFITVLIAILVTIAVMILIFVFVIFVLVPVMVTIIFMIVKYSVSSGFLRMAYDPAQAGEKTSTQYSGKWYKTLHLLPLFIHTSEHSWRHRSPETMGIPKLKMAYGTS